MLLSLAMLVSITACSQEPDDQKLRSLAASEKAQSRRAQEERKIRESIGRLGSVTGVHHVLTRFMDTCARPASQALWGSDDPQHTLVCDMEAAAYFGVRGDIVEVLPRIRAAAIANWGHQDEHGEDVPYAGGSVRYALDYYRNHGRYPDGALMSIPELESPGLRINWDLAPHQLVDEARPCPPAGYAYFRCELTPSPAATVHATRTEYGVVLVFEIGTRMGSSAHHYYTVPRRP
ncbi:hypothetical protein AB0H73_11495 [Streptomyces olivoreticuli]